MFHESCCSKSTGCKTFAAAADATWKSVAGPNRACRLDNGGNPDGDYDVVEVNEAEDIEKCKELCYSPKCYGVEFHEGGNGFLKRCELWKKKAEATKEVNGYQCFMKEITDLCDIGHVFSDGSLRSDAPTGCKKLTYFYDKLLFEEDLEVKLNVDYAPAFNNDPDPKIPNENSKLFMDIWTPLTIFHSDLRRPAIILVHGGHCRFGSKSEEIYQKYAKDFARRGWVAASIDYRLQSQDKKSCRTPGSIEAAGSDAKAAVRYFEANAERLMIDPDRIAIMGCSAGGRTSMYATFVEGSGVNRRPGSKWRNSQDNSNYPAKIAACVEMSADLYAPNEAYPVIKAKTDSGPKLMILHGAKDANEWTKCYVAENNYQQAVDAGIYAEKYITPEGGHCPGFNMDKIMNFLYEALSLEELDCGRSNSENITWKSVAGPNRACRLENSDEVNPDGNPDVVEVVKAEDIEKCKALCYSPKCYGVEFGEKNERCELWKKEAKATKEVNGYHCFVKDKKDRCDSDITWKSVAGPNRACRLENSDEINPDGNPDVVEVVKAEDIEKCKALCYSPKCYGVEFGEKNKRCELWKKEAKATKEVNGYHCFTKERTSTATQGC